MECVGFQVTAARIYQSVQLPECTCMLRFINSATATFCRVYDPAMESGGEVVDRSTDGVQNGMRRGRQVRGAQDRSIKVIEAVSVSVTLSSQRSVGRHITLAFKQSLLCF